MKNREEYIGSGGEWLASMRKWIQRVAVNGESVIWGSNDTPRMPTPTVRELEALAGEIGWAAALEEKRGTMRKYAEVVTNASEALSELKQLSLSSHVHGPHGIVARLDRALKEIKS